MIEFDWNNEKYEIRKAKYRAKSGETAPLAILIFKVGDYELYAKLSINLYESIPYKVYHSAIQDPETEFFVKTYSENEAIYNELKNKGFFIDTEKSVTIDYGTHRINFPVWKLKHDFNSVL